MREVQSQEVHWRHNIFRRHHHYNLHGVILFVDSNDPERIADVRDLLLDLDNEELLRDLPFLIFANKEDLKNAMSVMEITDKLGLYDFQSRQWFVQSSCANTGDGLNEG